VARLSGIEPGELGRSPTRSIAAIKPPRTVNPRTTGAWPGGSEFVDRFASFVDLELDVPPAPANAVAAGNAG
jgi:hypothetical protein